MKTHLLGFLALTVMVGVLATRSQAADPPGWKTSATIKVPALPTSVLLTDDHRFVIVQHEEKTAPLNKGGTAAFAYTFHILRCYNADTGKEVLNVNTDLKGRLRDMCVQGNTLAMTDDCDFIHLFDLQTGKEAGELDTTTPATDGPPNHPRKVSGDIRLHGMALTPDGKTLITLREEGEWKKDPKALGGYVGNTYQQIVFWDVEKKMKTDTLDCEDKQAMRGHMTFLRKSNTMLVYFDNGARILDMTTRKWGVIFPVKDVWFATLSADEKLLLICDHTQNVKVFDMATGKELSSFQETPISRRAYKDNRGKPVAGWYETGPVASFTTDEKVLRVQLNDGRSVVYRDRETGKDAKKPAATEPSIFSPDVQVLAFSPDREQAVTSPFRSVNLTVWRTSKLDNEKPKEKEATPKEKEAK